MARMGLVARARVRCRAIPAQYFFLTLRLLVGDGGGEHDSLHQSDCHAFDIQDPHPELGYCLFW